MNEEAADHPGELKELLNDQPGSPDGSGANFIKCMFLSGERLCRF
jgi:hypothetical protein